jgi:hypothetical protein
MTAEGSEAPRPATLARGGRPPAGYAGREAPRGRVMNAPWRWIVGAGAGLAVASSVASFLAYGAPGGGPTWGGAG